MHSIGEIIATYRKRNKLSQSELAALLGKNGYDLTNKAVSRWEKDGNEPSASLLLLLCKLLGITDIYNEYYGMNPDNPFSRLNDAGKEKAMEYINLLIDSGKYEKQKATIIPFRRNIRLFDTPVSAGTGHFIDDEQFVEIEVGEEVPESADFGVRITGNSMEPQFVHGQIVWVHQQESLNSGEIGIFFLDGDVYIKKFQDDSTGMFLISLNPEYQPIAVKEYNSFKIFGKVVG